MVIITIEIMIKEKNMNKIILIGNLTVDPELKYIEGLNKNCTRFVIAVDRNHKSSDGEIKADFIPVTIWGKKAEVVCKYMQKGDCISLSGRLRTGSYDDKDGNKRYISEVVADEFRFVGNKKSIQEA